MHVDIITFSCNYCFNIIELFKLSFNATEKHYKVLRCSQSGVLPPLCLTLGEMAIIEILT